MADPTAKFVSRAGLKLDHALREFGVNVSGWTCADFGCNVGGFTDCLLQRDAANVIAVDTGYGVLNWKLRSDPRVMVMERTNALHAAKPQTALDLVVIDLGWTQQRHAIPAAVRWLDSPTGSGGRLIISLIKPHYEVIDNERRLLNHGALAAADAQRVFDRVIAEFPGYGAEVVKHTNSPISGGKSGSRKDSPGNIEFLVLAAPIQHPNRAPRA